METLLNELFKNGVLNRDEFDVAVTENVEKINKQFKKIEKEEVDYSILFKGPIGEA